MHQSTTTNQNSRRIVLIDDDPAFCRIVENFATCRGLDLDCFSTLQEMGSLGRLSEYAVAIVDFDLGQMNGIEIAEYLPIFFGDMPMVLVSGKNRKENDRPWPKSVRIFVHKDQGPDAILDAAVRYLPNRSQTYEVTPMTAAVC